MHHTPLLLLSNSRRSQVPHWSPLLLLSSHEVDGLLVGGRCFSARWRLPFSRCERRPPAPARAPARASPDHGSLPCSAALVAPLVFSCHFAHSPLLQCRPPSGPSLALGREVADALVPSTPLDLPLARAPRSLAGLASSSSFLRGTGHSSCLSAHLLLVQCRAPSGPSLVLGGGSADALVSPLVPLRSPTGPMNDSPAPLYFGCHVGQFGDLPHAPQVASLRLGWVAQLGASSQLLAPYPPRLSLSSFSLSHSPAGSRGDVLAPLSFGGFYAAHDESVLGHAGGRDLLPHFSSPQHPPQACCPSASPLTLSSSVNPPSAFQLFLTGEGLDVPGSDSC